MPKYILIYDSGNGGQYVLQLFRDIMPDENYLLFKDIKHCPYGNKEKKELEEIFFSNITKIICKYQIKAIVIACNTMSSMFGKKLKQIKSLPKIFLILPLLNKKILQKTTLVLATENTCKYNTNIIKNKGNRNLHVLPLPHLAKEIDDNLADLSKLKRQIKAMLQQFKCYNIKNVVLGCTHYNYIKDYIKESLGKVKFYERSKNVAKSVYKYLQKNDLLSYDKLFIELNEI